MLCSAMAVVCSPGVSCVTTQVTLIDGFHPAVQVLYVVLDLPLAGVAVATESAPEAALPPAQGSHHCLLHQAGGDEAQ